MHTPVKYATRFFAVMVAAASLAVLFAPSPPTSNPYLSALSIVTVGLEATAANCENMFCERIHISCASNPLTKCFGKTGNCRTANCP